MSFQLKYHLLLPKTNRLFEENELIFTINHIKSRYPSVLYIIFHCFDIEGNEIYYDESIKQSTNDLETTGYTLSSLEDECAYVSSRGVIGTVFALDENGDYNQKILLNETLVEKTVYTQLELVTLGVSSENPLYLSELMLQEGDEFNGFHVPSELKNSHIIDLPNNSYANLYNGDGDFLQVIRPNKESFNTNQLDKAQYTILAPHFSEEDEIDNHVNVFLEAMNQTEQTIDILR